MITTRKPDPAGGCGLMIVLGTVTLSVGLIVLAVEVIVKVAR